MMQFGSSRRPTAARVAINQSRNQLKQIGLGLHNYHDVYQTFALGGIYAEDGTGLHGWQTAILPYLGQHAVYQGIQKEIPWDDPLNAPNFQYAVPQYLNAVIGATHDVSGYALSHYAANAGLFGKNQGHAKPQIIDGASNTIMSGEVINGFKPWGHPANWRDPGLGITGAVDTFGGPGGKGAQFLMSDGAVRFISDKIDKQILKALSTPAGKERVGNDWSQDINR